MHLVPITDLADPLLEDFTRLRDVNLRRKLEPAGGLYLAESSKVIARALAAGHRPRAVLLQPQWLPELEPLLAGHDVPVYVTDAAGIEQLTGFAMHRGALASFHRPPLPSVPEVLHGARRVVVLEDIVDHTNIGAVFRSGAALGADAVLITPRCADPLYRRAVRVSMATVLQVPWTRLPDWPEGKQLLAEEGFHLAALALSPNAVSLSEFARNAPEGLAIMLGTEGAGLSRRALSMADTVVTIPMARGIDSLNVAAAAAVALYALA